MRNFVTLSWIKPEFRQDLHKINFKTSSTIVKAQILLKNHRKKYKFHQSIVKKGGGGKFRYIFLSPLISILFLRFF